MPIDRVAGVNYPWTVFQGRPNYGCDFGRNVWGSHSGVSTHTREVAADLAAMARLGAEVVRWFVFADGRGAIRWSDADAVEGVHDEVWLDLDAALSLAGEAGVRLCLVLFDFAWMTSHAWRDLPGIRVPAGSLTTTDGQDRILSCVVDPLLNRYGNGGARADLGAAIHSIDVINEPDWVTRGLAFGRRHATTHVPRPFDRGSLRRLVRGVADRVHARSRWLVTVGGAKARFAAEWDDPAYALDFVQVHLYPRRWHFWHDRPIVGRPASTLALSKPVLIGECPANGSAEYPPGHRPPRASLDDYLRLADLGYLGVWPWSFKGVDGFGPLRQSLR